MSGGAFQFRVCARDGDARCGVLRLPHGEVETPAFMPVATYGAVRGVPWETLKALGAQMALGNAFHLHERPGEALIAEAGGLHGFTGWRGPWLTDSGGFQVNSLSARTRRDENGVTFRSPVDGRARELTPERSVEIQHALGADIAMTFDEVLPVEANDHTRARDAMQRSVRWAARSHAAHAQLVSAREEVRATQEHAAQERAPQTLFGIVQGGAHPKLRRESARAMTALGFAGYAHGGLGLGEAAAARAELIAEVHALLPTSAPRYLMGIGLPRDLLAGIARGVDLFDCVVPTRHARHGILFTGAGPLHITAARFRRDFRTPDADCDCPVCARVSRAYLCHLLRIKERLGATLASIHNLRFTFRLLEHARAAIRDGRFDSFHKEFRAKFEAPASSSAPSATESPA